VEEYGTAGASRPARTMRSIIAWIALLAVIWAVGGFWGQFTRDQAAMSSGGQGSTGTTSTTGAEASVTTTVTDLIATPRVDMSLNSEPSTSTAVIAKSLKGSDLEVLAKQGAWFRVKDEAGHIGWIPNDAKLIEVKKK
jgi:hypothetical protein